MKRIFALLLLCMICTSFAAAQHLQVSYKQYTNTRSMCVIRPTIDNFLYLINCNEYQFRTEMSYYGYYEYQPTPNSYYITYWNGSLDNFTDAYACNLFGYARTGEEIRCAIPSDMIYPYNAINDLRQSLKPYFVETRYNHMGQPIDTYSIFRGGKEYEIDIMRSENSSSNKRTLIVINAYKR